MRVPIDGLPGIATGLPMLRPHGALTSVMRHGRVVGGHGRTPDECSEAELDNSTCS